MASVEEILTTADLMTLVDSGRELSAEVNLQKLLQSILTKASEMTDSPDTSVILHNEQRNTLYFAGATGEKAEMLLTEIGEFSEKQIPIDGSIAGAVFTSGQSIVDQQVSADPKHFKGVDENTKKSTESMVCVPLTAGGKALGVMQLLNKRHGGFTERDRVLLEYFSSQAAIAIRNAKLLDTLLSHMGLYASREDHGGPFELLKELDDPPKDETLTVLFADMRRFSRLCRSLKSKALMQEFLGEFLTMLSEQVFQQHGVVNKFLGDGLLALFRDEHHAERAVRCAFAMIVEFEDMPHRWQEHVDHSLAFLDIGVGIATGEVIVGSTGDRRIRDFTVFGDPVNLAAALEQHARDGRRILASQSTYSAIKEFVKEIEGPETFFLKRHDQDTGTEYLQYHLKSLEPQVTPRVFISHSHLDRDFVDHQLVAPFAACGIETWYCRDDIRAGEAWVQEVAKGIEKCNWFAVLVSEHAVESDWVQKEVDLAISLKRLHGRIIPIVLDDTDPSAISSWLGTAQRLDAREGQQMVDQLSKQIRKA